MSSLALSFNDVNFSPVQQDNQLWLGSTQIGLALGYANPETAITKLYNRNADEFRSDMTKLIETDTAGGLQKVRIFSLRGCHLIAMFARTAVAKQFRKWVLDVLDKEVGATIVKTHKSERTALHDAHTLLVAKTKHLNSSDAWKLINQRFGTNSIDEIPYDVIPVAVEYVHHLIALYSAAEKRKDTEPHIHAVLHDKNVQFLMWYVPILAKFIKNEVYPALTAMQSSYAGRLGDLVSETVSHANILNRKAIGYGLTLEHVGNKPPHSIEWYLKN
ncbi:MAG: Bro-N domain-containing protein [Acinetobacter sp.]|nr:Bro-N domain-containing protein [Acinetobacter sp.]